MNVKNKHITAISLFSGGGIGDLALRSCNINVLVASELLLDRSAIYNYNYPETLLITGDLKQNKNIIINETISKLNGKTLDIIFATPPCQGMSKNGKGKLLNSIRSGKKYKYDERNLLSLEIIDIALQLKPHLIVLENVPEMQNTIIELPNKKIVNLLNFMQEQLSSIYKSCYEIIEFADYGIPQRRKRLFTIFSRNEKINYFISKGETIFPKKTHNRKGNNNLNKWISVNDALKGVPSLDGISKEKSNDKNIPYHNVPVLDKNKYFWIKHTPPKKSAFDNQCINEACLYQHNILHKSNIINNINKNSKNTPIYCIKCNSLLPRPVVIKNNTYHIMAAFSSSYKRMDGDLPSSTLTKNLSYVSSDNKIHPTENRALSLYEAMILHTIKNYKFEFKRNDNKKVSDKLVRDIIGESIPPLGLEIIFKHIIQYL